MSGDEPEDVGAVIEFPDELYDPADGEDRRWVVLYPEDYDNFMFDGEDNLGVLVNEEQASELLRLAAEALVACSGEDTDGRDITEAMPPALEEVLADV